MTKFVNAGADTDLYFPAGHPDSLFVEAGQLVDLGDLKVEDGGDCWLVGEGDNVRAWSKDRWQKQGSAGAKKADDKGDKSTEKSEKPAAKPSGPDPADKTD
jgi:hypothetical protein